MVATEVAFRDTNKIALLAERLVPDLTSARDPIYTHVPTTHMTFVFCVFELMTLFNMFNCRVLVGENRGSNVFKVHFSPWHSLCKFQ